MLIVRIFVNLVIFAIEICAVVGVAWLGWRYPIVLAGLATVLALFMGLALERARLENEIGFYFGRAAKGLSWAGASLAIVEAGLKALLAGVVTLITFSGTDPDRLLYIAVIFGITVFAGTSVLRRVSIMLSVNPSRWGYFRLAPLLGLLYSGLIHAAESIRVGGAAFLPVPSLTELAQRLVLQTPSRPTLQQASDLLFLLKQKFDDIVVGMLALVMPPNMAALAGILVSVNVLTGFAVGVFAVAIAEIVRRLEEGAPR
jgi:hypothetical protein